LGLDGTSDDRISSDTVDLDGRLVVASWSGRITVHRYPTLCLDAALARMVRRDFDAVTDLLPENWTVQN
jgi:hypothetical protein